MSLVVDSNPQFEALNAVTAQLQQFECRMTALHDANTNRPQPPRNSRPQQRRPRGQQRNNGPRSVIDWFWLVHTTVASTRSEF